MLSGNETFESLPPHLTQVLAPLAEGKTNGEIADDLSLALHIVEQYVSEIKLVTGCRDRVDLVLRVREYLG